jgi:hypothetical protein
MNDLQPMDDREALELLDAHLDDQNITQEQANALSLWLRDHPEHADRAFQRIFLHSFLRQRMQFGTLANTTAPLLPGDSGVISSGTSNILTLDPIEKVDLTEPVVSHPPRSRFPWLISAIAVCMLGVIGAIAYPVYLEVTKPPVGLWCYEGFDYPITTPPAPLGDGNKWPTSGGMQDLNGGTGWAEPWHEDEIKVSVLIADTHLNAWRSTDMRKYGPLIYADGKGNTLQTTGIQLRTAAGPVSTSVRKLNPKDFPPAVVDEQGIGKDGTVLWISFLAQSFDGRGIVNFAYVQFGDDHSAVRLGKIASVPSGNWAACGLVDGAEMNTRWSEISSGNAVMYLVRISFKQGGTMADVWLNPKLDHEPELSTATMHVPLPSFRLNQLSISSRYTTDFDELRIGGSFRDVTPLKLVKP